VGFDPAGSLPRRPRTSCGPNKTPGSAGRPRPGNGGTGDGPTPPTCATSTHRRPRPAGDPRGRGFPEAEGPRPRAEGARGAALRAAGRAALPVDPDDVLAEPFAPRGTAPRNGDSPGLPAPPGLDPAGGPSAQSPSGSIRVSRRGAASRRRGSCAPAGVRR
jgi:hypothetical protein